MKYVKMLGLLAVAAAALMAFAGTAAASTLTDSAGSETAYTGEIVATSTNSKLDGAFVTVECSHSEAKGTVEQHGEVNAGGAISALTFTGCNYETTVNKKGTLSIDSKGTTYSSGAEVTIKTSVGTCVFTTNNTDVGTLTESNETAHEVEGKKTDTTAVLDISSAKIPRTGGNFLCGSSGTWTGSYTVTTPDLLYVD